MGKSRDQGRRMRCPSLTVDQAEDESGTGADGVEGGLVSSVWGERFVASVEHGDGTS